MHSTRKHFLTNLVTMSEDYDLLPRHRQQQCHPGSADVVGRKETFAGNYNPFTGNLSDKPLLNLSFFRKYVSATFQNYLVFLQANRGSIPLQKLDVIVVLLALERHSLGQYCQPYSQP